MRQIATILGLEVRFCERIRFLGGPSFLRSRVRVQSRFLDNALPVPQFFGQMNVDKTGLN